MSKILQFPGKKTATPPPPPPVNRAPYNLYDLMHATMHAAFVAGDKEITQKLMTEASEHLLARRFEPTFSAATRQYLDDIDGLRNEGGKTWYRQLLESVYGSR